ncbi:MAG: RluA family pseudouridine synthase, partial [Planctomycetota bacterium]
AGLELPVLAEDEWLVAIDKPPNLLVHPVGKRRFGSVINLLHARYRFDDPARDVIPLLAHRIDQETTGVLLVAKGKPARAAFYKLFEQQPVIKEYLALVEGHLQPPAGRIDLPIGSRRHEIHVTRGINHDDGLPAQSLYRVEQRLPGFDLVRVRLVSGRQHQVRLHMEALGHPLLGDLYYGVRRQLTIDDAAAIVAAAVVQPPPPLPDLPPADELFAAPEQLPLVDQVNASWRFRMTMIPPDGPDPWADDHEAELMADPEYQEASPPTRPVGFNPDPAVLIDRVALHAARLAFVHPLSDPPVEMDIRAPLPPDMSAVIAALGSASSR